MIPFILLSAIAIVLTVLGWAWQIYPRRTLVLWAIFPALLATLLISFPHAAPALIAFDLLLLVVLSIDLATLPQQGWFTCAREMQRVASLKKPHPVRLLLGNRATRWQEVTVRDDLPDECDAECGEFTIRLAPQSRSHVSYQLEPRRRGEFQLANVYLRVSSRLGLWQRHFRFSCQSVLHVYPNMRQMRDYALLARSDRLSLLGVRRSRKVGQDNEFERLRDYTLDDNYKHIDWRSTARRGKLTVKDFQVNQSQRVIFLIDCGRMMTGTSQGISLLDHALNAALMLSYVALNKGDSVGLLCFADGIQRFVPPRGGMNQMNRLLHASFDRFASFVESRYDQAFVYLNSRCRKRALVVLLTNIIDEVNSNQVQRYLKSLVGRHLPLAVLIRDHAIFDAANNVPGDENSLYRAAAASEIINWRRSVLTDLEQKGVLSLDVFPEELTAPLINRYLEIKARHLL